MRNIALIVAHAWLWVFCLPYALFNWLAGEWFERCQPRVAIAAGVGVMVATIAWVVGVGLLVEWAMEGAGL